MALVLFFCLNALIFFITIYFCIIKTNNKPFPYIDSSNFAIILVNGISILICMHISDHYGIDLIKFFFNHRHLIDEKKHAILNTKSTEIIRFLIDSDINILSGNDFFTDQIKIIIKEKELEEYYYSVKIFSKDDVSNYIKNKDTENIKKCKSFDFSEDNYKFFLVALMSKDAKIVRIIYDFINDKNKLINFIQNHNNILEKDDLILFNSLMD